MKFKVGDKVQVNDTYPYSVVDRQLIGTVIEVLQGTIFAYTVEFQRNGKSFISSLQVSELDFALNGVEQMIAVL